MIKYMPLYDYKCPSCGHTTELILKHTDPAPHCPVCHVTMNRSLSVPGGYKMPGATSTQMTRSSKRNGK